MFRLGLVVLALFAAAFSPPASARMLGDSAVPFSADRLLTLGERSFTGKVYAMPGSQRHEQLIQGIPQVIILHGDEAKGWLVLPALNSYVEFGFAPAAIELSDQSLLSTPVGEETIEGRRTSKYRVEHADADGSFVDGYIWLTREGIPMRLDANYTPRGGRSMSVHMELSHVRVGPQDAALFTVPQNMVKLPTNALAPLMGLRKAG